MKLKLQFFHMDEQWCVVHQPKKPNGFAIMVIGDANHFVDRDSSFWLQNYARYSLLENFLNDGYTVFYSNLYGRNWGSPKAVILLNRLYELVKRKNILNEKIHVLAEGMGGITALKLMKKMEGFIRSIALITPCLDLKMHNENEKNNKLFYKRFIKDLSESYLIEKNQVVETVIDTFDLREYKTILPVKIWHVSDKAHYSLSHHARAFEKINDENVEISIHLFETLSTIGKPIVDFYKNYEHPL